MHPTGMHSCFRCKMAGRQAKSSSAAVAVCEDCIKGEKNRYCAGKVVNCSSLDKAAVDGHVECLQALLDAGADVNYVNSEKEHALVLAAGDRKDQCVEMLVKAGADVNIADSIGKTALMFASKYGNIKSVELLLEAGADVNKADNYGYTALMFAAASSHNDIPTLLIKAGADVNAVDEEGFTAVHKFAISSGDSKCADALAKAGADLNLLTDYRTPLMYAVTEERYKSAEALIKAGADVNKFNEGGANVLHWATGRGQEFYELFIKAGVDVNVKSESFEGETPLMQCLDFSLHEVAEMMTEAGADVNITHDGVRPTVLFCANETRSVKLLLRSGARINVKNNEGHNALERALSRKRRYTQELCSVLFAAGETVHEVKNILFHLKSNDHHIKVRTQGH